MGDPSCHSTARNTKHIARDIVLNIKAITVGDASGESDDIEEAEVVTNGKNVRGGLKCANGSTAESRKRLKTTRTASVKCGGYEGAVVEKMSALPFIVKILVTCKLQRSCLNDEKMTATISLIVN